MTVWLAPVTREQFPSADHVVVYCERCQRIHKRIVFSREDFDRVVSEGAAQLAAAIDAEVLRYAMERLEADRC